MPSSPKLSNFELAILVSSMYLTSTYH